MGNADVFDILRDAHLATELDTELVCIDNDQEVIDGIRVGDAVFTIARGDYLGGDEADGYGYTFGTLTEGGYDDESGARWAATEADARQALADWLAGRATGTDA